MTYPKELFYQESTSLTRYQQEATSTLSVDRLLRGDNAYWVSSSLNKTYKKKHLVLADWSAIAWPYDKIIAVQKKLQQLLDDGFEIELWQKDRLIALNAGVLNQLHDSELRQAMIAQEAQEIIARASVSYEKLLILDDYWIRQLLSDKEDLEPRSLSLYEAYVAQRNGNINNWLLQAQPPVDFLLDDGCQNDYTSVRLTYSHLPQKEGPKRALNLIELKHDTAQYVEKLYVTDNPLEEHQLSALEGATHLEAIDCLGCSSVTAVLKVLARAAPNIHHLSIDHCSDLFLIELNPNCFSRLATFLMRGSELLMNDLSALFLAAPQLKKVELMVDFNFRLVSLEHGCLSQLEELCFAPHNRIFEDVMTLLMAAPKLKELKLGSNVTTYDLDKLPKGHFYQLEKINLAMSDISSEGLNALLLASPKLKRITLYGCKQIIGLLTLPNNCLPYLEDIDLGDSSF